MPLQAILILFFSKAGAGWWGSSDLLQRAHSETGNGVTLARLVPYGYKGESNPHHPCPSVTFHTMFAEGALVLLRATLILFFSGWEQAGEATPISYKESKGYSSPHYPCPSVTFRTMITEGVRVVYKSLVTCGGFSLRQKLERRCLLKGSTGPELRLERLVMELFIIWEWFETGRKAKAPEPECEGFHLPLR
ncbi:hypothetical protein JOD24_003390 [Kroppenstedtia sanguinis]